MEDLKMSIYNKERNTYYIHAHEEAMYSLTSRKSASSFFDWHKSRAINAVKNKYQEAFKQSISGPNRQNIINMLNQQTPEEMDRLIKEVSDEVGNQLNEGLLSQSGDMQGYYQSASGALSAIKGLSGSSDIVNNFDKLLTQMGKAIELLDGKKESLGPILEIMGVQHGKLGTRGYPKNYAGISRIFANMINQIPKDKLIKIEENEISRGILHQLDLTGQMFAQIAGSSSLSSKQIKDKLAGSIINNFFSKQIAEPLSAAATAKAMGAADSYILTGSQSYKNSDLNKSITAKADWVLPHIQQSVTIDSSKDQVAEFTIGISGKFYSSVDMSSEELKGSISNGSGGSLKEALSLIFGTGSSIGQYFSRNLLSFPVGSDSEDALSLQDLLLKRQILRMMATSGNKQDFAQYIFINGQIFSIFDIMNYVLNTKNLGRSFSLLDSNSDQAVALSIKGRKDIIATNQSEIAKMNGANRRSMYMAWERSRFVNEKIDAAVIQAEIRLEQLYKILKVA